jgi:glycosyltransferase involved in cell wall biosynthesis
VTGLDTSPRRREDAAQRDALQRLAAARSLARCWRAGDEVALDGALTELFANDPARRIEEVGPAALGLLREAFEALDDFLLGCVLGPGASELAWRRLFVPDEGGLPLPQLLMNAFWLRGTGSSRVGVGAPLPVAAELARLPGAQQGLLLARFCLRHDAATPLDLAALAAVLDARLRTLLETWLFRVYLMSPGTFLDEAVQENRRRVLRDYPRATADWAIGASWDPLASLVLYRASYVTEHERDFVEAAVTRRVAPALAGALGPAAAAPPRRTDRLGVITSRWTSIEPVHRCLAPLVEGILTPALESFPLDRDPRERPFGAGWRAGEVAVRETPRAGAQATLAEHARHLAERELDFLFFPEVGLDVTARCLATRRLARVQALGYGHPATSGSRAMDYFVGGAAVERDPRRYSERLVLVPGLGVASTPPPPPRAPRARPLDDERVQLFSVSSFDKLNPALLDAWGEVLFESPRAHLHMFPGWRLGRCQREQAALARSLPAGRVSLVGRLPRAALIDRLEDADVYLDSYPFGGFNTLIEVLSAGVPVVTFEGRLARNRFGAALLRLLGMPEELIARSWGTYVAAAARLVRDAGWRMELRARLGRERVLAALAAQDAAAHFAAAVEWMRAEGPRDGRPAAPVLVRAGEAPRVVEDLACLSR